MAWAPKDLPAEATKTPCQQAAAEPKTTKHSQLRHTAEGSKPEQPKNQKKSAAATDSL